MKYNKSSVAKRQYNKSIKAFNKNISGMSSTTTAISAMSVLSVIALIASFILFFFLWVKLFSNGIEFSPRELFSFAGVIIAIFSFIPSIIIFVIMRKIKGHLELKLTDLSLDTELLRDKIDVKKAQYDYSLRVDRYGSLNEYEKGEMEKYKESKWYVEV